jgi:hypothetical protein
MYNTGFEFFRDLCVMFGKEKALAMGNEYLTLQENDDRATGRFKNDPEEFQFCKELYHAMKA